MPLAKYILYLHPRGAKLYPVDHPDTPVVDINDPQTSALITALKPYQRSTMRLLLSDPLSYLFQTVIPKVPDDQLKSAVLSKIKTEIPEDFDNYLWDYQVIKTNPATLDILVFAPIKDTEKNIIKISRELKINFEVIEPESVATGRNANPILAIINKGDLNLPDPAELNLKIGPVAKSSPRRLSLILTIIFLLAVIAVLYYFVPKIFRPKTVINPPPILTLIPEATTTPTPVDLRILITVRIENGSTRAGAAAKLAAVFNQAGFTRTTTGNASNNNYSQTKVIYKSQTLQQDYQSLFDPLLVVSPGNISVDTNQTDDVIVIIGKN